MRSSSLPVAGILKLYTQYRIIVFSEKDTNLAVEKFVGGTDSVSVGRNSNTARVYHVFSCQENRSLIFFDLFLINFLSETRICNNMAGKTDVKSNINCNFLRGGRGEWF